MDVILNGRILSAEEAARYLAVPCYLVLREFADVIFPTTTHYRPSRRVVVLGNGKSYQSPIPTQGLPIFVDGEQWNRCVVPVLKSSTFDPENLATWNSPPWEVVGSIGRALGVSFGEAGYGPYP